MRIPAFNACLLFSSAACKSHLTGNCLSDKQKTDVSDILFSREIGIDEVSKTVVFGFSVIHISMQIVIFPFIISQIFDGLRSDGIKIEVCVLLHYGKKQTFVSDSHISDSFRSIALISSIQ